MKKRYVITTEINQATLVATNTYSRTPETKYWDGKDDWWFSRDDAKQYKSKKKARKALKKMGKTGLKHFKIEKIWVR